MAADNVTYLMERVQAMNNTLVDFQSQTEQTAVDAALLWRMTTGIFVFLMQLGFSLLEAGTVRFKNTRNIMIKNVLDTCVCAMAFWMFGYGIGFGNGTRIFGWKDPYDDKVAFFGAMNGPTGVDFFFQFTFAATSTTIIAGAVAERTHLAAYLFYNFFLSSLIYPVVAHMIWAGNGWLSASRGVEILGTNGLLDNAGSMVVHVTGGVTSLVGAWMVGPRIGRFDIEGKPVPIRGYSMVYVAAGTITLWVGFYGFNGGSVSLLGQAENVWTYEVARVCLNTTLSAAFSGLTVFVYNVRLREPVLEDNFNGVIGGLVAACATSSIVEPFAAAIIGIGAGFWYLVGVWVMYRIKVDDVVMAAPTHLFCGTWGALAVGFFATKHGIKDTYNIKQPLGHGIFYGGNGKQLAVQILGLIVVYVWVGLTTFVLFFGLDYFNMLRVKRKEEELGLDVAFHGGLDANEDHPEGKPSRRLSLAGVSGVTTRRFRPFGGAGIPVPSFGNLFNKFGATGSGARLPKPKGNEPFGRGQRRDLWFRPLESTPFGHFSFAMYEANYVMEDFGEVEASSSGIYIGIHNGHGGTPTSEFLSENLYENLKDQFVGQGGGISADSIRSAYAVTDQTYIDLVRDVFHTNPEVATVGASSLAVIVTANAVWVANLGDCRAVLGQVRKSESGLECRALQLSVSHSLEIDNVRDEYVKEHEETPDAVVSVDGKHLVKGKIGVTRSIGDLHLKSHEFNGEPLFVRYRVPEPFNPPLLGSEPSITVRLLSPYDAFVIAASDGLFQYLSNQEAVDLVGSSPRKDAARRLIIHALHKVADSHQITYEDLLRMPPGQRRRYHDDITVVVFFFDYESSVWAQRDNNWEQQEGSVRGGGSSSTRGGSNVVISTEFAKVPGGGNVQASPRGGYDLDAV